MNIGHLFECLPDAPSLRVKLTAFKKKHGIKTHRAKWFSREEEPWLALIPFEDDKGKNVGQIMAESCRLYEESERCAFGTGELTAVRKLCQQQGIVCEL